MSRLPQSIFGRTPSVTVASSTASNPSSYDFICDGVADDVQIQAALNTLRTTGGTVQLSKGTFVLSARIICAVADFGSNPIALLGEKNTIVNVTALSSVAGSFYFSGAVTSTTSNLSGNSLAGALSVSVVNGALFAVGDYVLIDDSATLGINTIGEIVQIESIVANTLTFSESLVYGYTIANSAKVTKLTMFPPIEVSNFQILGNPADLYGGGVRIDYALYPNIHDLWIKDTRYMAVQFWHVYMGQIHHNLMEGINSPGLGYATSLVGACKGINHHNNQVRDSIKVISIGGGPTVGVTLNTISQGNVGFNVDQGYETHGESQYTSYIGNELHTNMGHGYLIGSNNEVGIVSNNRMTGGNNDGVSSEGTFVCGGGGSNQRIVLTGNHFSWNTTSASAQDWAVRVSAGASGVTLIMEDNIFVGYGTVFSNAGAGTILHASRNVGYVTENSGTGTIANGATSAVITHGCGYTPVRADITVTLGENPSNTPGAIWIDTITATQFTVNCENDPGVSALDFSWAVRRV